MKNVFLFVTKKVHIFGAKMILVFVVSCRNETLCFFKSFNEVRTTVIGLFSNFVFIQKKKKFSSRVWSIANIPEFFKRDEATGIHPIEGFLELPLQQIYRFSFSLTLDSPACHIHLVTVTECVFQSKVRLFQR